MKAENEDLTWSAKLNCKNKNGTRAGLYEEEIARIMIAEGD